MTADDLSLILVGLWVLGCCAFLLWVIYGMPTFEVRPEDRCPGCGRWLGHKWRCTWR